MPDWLKNNMPDWLKNYFVLKVLGTGLFLVASLVGGIWWVVGTAVSGMNTAITTQTTNASTIAAGYTSRFENIEATLLANQQLSEQRYTFLSQQNTQILEKLAEVSTKLDGMQKTIDKIDYDLPPEATETTPLMMLVNFSGSAPNLPNQKFRIMSGYGDEGQRQIEFVEGPFQEIVNTSGWANFLEQTKDVVTMHWGSAFDLSANENSVFGWRTATPGTGTGTIGLPVLFFEDAQLGAFERAAIAASLSHVWGHTDTEWMRTDCRSAADMGALSATLSNFCRPDQEKGADIWLAYYGRGESYQPALSPNAVPFPEFRTIPSCLPSSNGDACGVITGTTSN